MKRSLLNHRIKDKLEMMSYNLPPPQTTPFFEMTLQDNFVKLKKEKQKPLNCYRALFGLYSNFICLFTIFSKEPPKYRKKAKLKAIKTQIYY